MLTPAPTRLDKGTHTGVGLHVDAATCLDLAYTHMQPHTQAQLSACTQPHTDLGTSEHGHTYNHKQLEPDTAEQGPTSQPDLVSHPICPHTISQEITPHTDGTYAQIATYIHTGKSHSQTLPARGQVPPEWSRRQVWHCGDNNMQTASITVHRKPHPPGPSHLGTQVHRDC